MSNTKLYNKYRVKSLDDIVGDLPFVHKLKEDMKNGWDHTYMFYGQHGISKTSVARIIGNSIPDCYIEEISASVENGVSTSKAIARSMNDLPIGCSNRLIILDEIQKASSAFFDALLKATEETGEHIFFILCTTEFAKIPANIKSRFTKIKFTEPDMKSMRDHLTFICEQEGIKANRRTLTEICRINKNIPRDCISSLQLIVGVDDIEIQLELISATGIQESATGYEIAKALGNDWKIISDLLKDVKLNDVEGIRRTVLAYHRKVLLSGKKSSALILDSFIKEMYDTPLDSLVLACYENSNI